MKWTNSESEHLRTEARSRDPGRRFLPLLLVTQRGLPLESGGEETRECYCMDMREEAMWRNEGAM